MMWNCWKRSGLGRWLGLLLLASCLASTAFANLREDKIAARPGHGLAFWKDLPAPNNPGPRYTGVTIHAAKPGAEPGGCELAATERRAPYTPPATESPSHDVDGSLSEDARWTYNWDAENRLIQMTEKTVSPAPASYLTPARQRLTFTYDPLSRRSRKVVETYNASLSTWNTLTDRRFLYDGWNLIAEFDASSSLLVSSAWGLDLSGSGQGAGGVGGLLYSTYYPASGSPEVSIPSYDGNGNVCALLDATTGSIVARLDYDPFGNTLRATGPRATKNPFRFSTKYDDAETGLLYYGYRYYSPESGRWLSTDPIAERGGINLYGMVRNDPVNRVDRLGLIEYNFDEYACTLNVKVKWKLTFGSYDSGTDKFAAGAGWNDEEKQQWKQKAESAVEGYYSKLKKKCKPSDKCCPCKKGVSVKFDLQYVESDADMDVKVSDNPWHRGSAMNPKQGWFDQDDTQPAYTGPGTEQTTLVHEMGHGLGLAHPGHDSNPPAEPNSPEDYEADPKSLMGRGMTLRRKDQNKAFCSKIKPAGKTEKPCTYSAK
jgi:RHS repeat-associated protein